MGEGSVSIAYIMQSFDKLIVSFFGPVPPPMRAALCKLLVEVLDGSQVIVSVYDIKFIGHYWLYEQFQ